MTQAEALDPLDMGFDQRDEPGSSLAPCGMASWLAIYREFRGLLSQFDPIGLPELEAVALLDRTDTKYVMSARQAYSALALLPEHYRVLDIVGARLSRYRTLYFDTDDFALYMHHHSGKRARYKVRSRQYVDTDQSFLEVKGKAKRDRTTKERIPTADFVTRWVGDASDSLSSRLPGEAQSLEPKVSNEFYRITLAGKHHRERVTLDLGLYFGGNGRTVALPGVAVAEVKQDGVNRNSDFVRHMRALGIRPNGFSKYCVAVSLLFQEVKHNQFKPKLRLIGELMGGNHDA